MDHSELGEPSNGFRFKFLEPHEHETVLKLLEDNLYEKALEGLGYDHKGAEDWNELFGRMMKNGKNLSYIAVDIETGEIAGCRMVDLIVKDDSSSDLTAPYPSYFKHQANINAFKLCADVMKDLHIFDKFNLTEYPEMYGLTTVDKFRQRGLAGEMYRRGLNYLQKRGYPIVKGSFTSPFTRRAATKLGYQEFVRRYFPDCKDDNGRVLDPECDPKGFICAGVFDLRKRQLQ